LSWHGTHSSRPENWHVRMQSEQCWIVHISHTDIISTHMPVFLHQLHSAEWISAAFGQSTLPHKGPHDPHSSMHAEHVVYRHTSHLVSHRNGLRPHETHVTAAHVLHCTPVLSLRRLKWYTAQGGCTTRLHVAQSARALPSTPKQMRHISSAISHAETEQ
jgi:hypothetical protein